MRLLLIDTCGEVGSVALSEGETIAASENRGILTVSPLFNFVKHGRQVGLL